MGLSTAKQLVLAIPVPVRIGMLLVLIALSSVASFLYVNRPKPSVLTDKDTILLTEFENRTGEALFDGALRQGLALQLQQSPFLEVLSDKRLGDTLRSLKRAPDTPVIRELGREIAQHQGLKVFITGLITKPERYYLVTLEALDSQTGNSLVQTQTEAESRDAVLHALSQGAAELRSKLGEKLITVRRYAALLEVAFNSLEALKAYTLAYEAQARGKYYKAIPLYQRALELDPNSAIGYRGLAEVYDATQQTTLATEAAIKAYDLRERMGELENFRLTYLYHSLVTGELEKCVGVLLQQQHTYPRNGSVSERLAHTYSLLGQFAEAVEAAAEGLKRDPQAAGLHEKLALALLRLNRFDEARAACQSAIEQRLDSSVVHYALYQLAVLNSDTAAQQQEVGWAHDEAGEYPALEWQAQAATFGGQWQHAQEFNRAALTLDKFFNPRAAAARYAANQALRAAAIGQCNAVGGSANQALAFDRQKFALSRAALAYTLCDQPALAQLLHDELVKRFPKDTLITGLWLPIIRAALELQRGNADLAVEQLKTTQRLEAAAEFWSQYLRGQAYLKLNQFAAAETEFQKILAQRGEAPLSLLYPLAHLGVARAAFGNNNAAKARQAYQAFLALWKEADTDLPVLSAARKEYAAVQ
jgi:eukaryotic-like serine/threonine-protein kinase